IYGAEFFMSSLARRHIVNRCLPVLRKNQLHVADVAFGESGGAVVEVVLPHADEAVIETELLDLGQSGVETITPRTKRVNVMKTDIFVCAHGQARNARDRTHHLGECSKFPAG